MTLLPLARTLLSAFAPVLSLHDSTTIVRPASAPAPVVAPAPAPDPTKLLGSRDTTASVTAAPVTDATETAASDEALAAITAAKVEATRDGRVPTPVWTFSTHTGLLHAGRADSIVVEKSEHRMTLYAGGQPLGVYQVALGQRAVGQKERAGDLRTPEGLYHIDARNPNSRFHLALHVSYPNAGDVARARALGVSTGGDIMIHGLPPAYHEVGAGHRQYDWTNGCIAVTDQEIEEIWSAVPVGTPVRIKP
jgi:lipoprotein-anchoring transpeptidase ErfK/SrfK